ncbi:MAG: crotonase/enoyl-CoA hydratase family protein [Acidimicrobiia bacterium]|nr:crotonase/enoyl-CoA hydratase family protein [Acidimicrobiia bacterium]
MTSTSPLTVTTIDTAVVARFDDGGANVLGHAAVDGLNMAVDAAEEARLPLVIIGREAMFSAGFDLRVFEEGVEPFALLVARGAELLHRIVSVPVPVVVGATGHAVAMGSLLLLAADYRVGAEPGVKAFKVGLNEVSIGMALPNFAVQLAQHRLSRRHLQRATVLAEMYSSEGAVDAGYLDEVVPAEQLEATVMAKAESLSTYSRGALAATKRLMRADLAAALAAAIEADKAALGPAAPGPAAPGPAASSGG